LLADALDVENDAEIVEARVERDEIDLDLLLAVRYDCTRGRNKLQEKGRLSESKRKLRAFDDGHKQAGIRERQKAIEEATDGSAAFQTDATG
jgi:hypothetical protein